jgi:hypothetical protein
MSNFRPENPDDVARVLFSIRKEGIAARGRSDLVKFVSGQRVTPLQAIRAKCYDCSGYYVDGKQDCGQSDCPLYRFMPYRPGVEDVEGEDPMEGEDQDEF